MNPITFNNNLERAIKVHPDRLERLFKNWRNAPLFDYTTTWDKENALLPERMVIKDLLEARWPFDTLRVSITETDVPRFAGGWPLEQPDELNPKAIYRNHFVATKDVDTGRFHFLIEVKQLGHDPKALAELSPFLILITTEFVGDASRLDYTIEEVDAGWCFTYAYKGKWSMKGLSDRKGVLYDDSGRTDLLRLRPYVQGMLAVFTSFILDSMSPSTFLAQVSPSDGDRQSVQWREARTHYTLITHGHAANQKHLNNGHLPTIRSDRQGELTRMAHDRRAHKRTLRSSRFTYARGKTIDVRACWVGPKEWKDEGGRQIYRILEPVA
jgi:hypothetical protein